MGDVYYIVLYNVCPRAMGHYWYVCTFKPWLCIYIYVSVPSAGQMLSCLGTATDLLDIPRQTTWQDCIG